MMENIREEYRWWEETPGPRALLNKVEETLLRGGGLWLRGRQPWWETFQELVKERLSEQNSLINVECRRWDELGSLDPAQELLGLVPEYASIYFPSTPLVDFIQSRGILKNTIFWVSGMDESPEAEAWLEVSRQLARKKAGLRLVCEGDCCTKNAKNIQLLESEHYVSEFDRLFFSMSLLPEGEQDPEMKLYVCRLACGISGGDPELLGTLLSQPHRLAEDPAAWTEEVCPERLEGVPGAVWKAQIQTIYPVLEEGNQALVNGNGEDILACLPYTDNWGLEIAALEDVELRHLCFCQSERGLRLSDADQKVLNTLYKARNDLSHRHLLSYDRIRDVLRCPR